jgi:hypothetical protein
MKIMKKILLNEGANEGWTALMRAACRFVLSVVLLSIAILGAAEADQAVWVSREEAEAAAAVLVSQDEIKLWCEPCDDPYPLLCAVEIVETRRDEGDYWSVWVNGESMDLAYVYVMDGGRWVNLAEKISIDVEGVSSVLDDEPEGNPGQKAVNVRDAKQFLEALGSNTTIVMKPGKYKLSEWDHGYRDDRESVKLQKGVSLEYVFYEDADEGSEITLKGIKNLTIRAEGNGRAEIIIDPRYAYVLNFIECSNISIDHIEAGHSEGGYCSGGVFSFEDSSEINIDGTGMYGCGAEGLHLSRVWNVAVKDSVIYECDGDIMTILESRNISFDRCIFRNNGGNDEMIQIDNTSGVSFANCDFLRNGGKAMFKVSYGSKNIVVKKSAFSGNAVGSPIEDSDHVSFDDCRFD